MFGSTNIHSECENKISLWPISVVEYTWQKAFLCRKIFRLAMIMESRCVSCQIGDGLLNTVWFNLKFFGRLNLHMTQISLSNFYFCQPRPKKSYICKKV
jgi:hypothetical protein